MIKTFAKISLVAVCFLALSGCGHVKNAKQLIRQARRTYGECEVISKIESDEMTKVVLQDSLQGFQYEIYSSMNDINIDGSSFGSVPGTYDNFSESLQAYAINDSKAALNSLCNQYGASYETFTGEVILNLMMKPSATDEDAVNLTEEVAALMQQYNENNRMDGYVIYVSHDDEWLKQLYDELLSKNGGDYSGYIFSSAGGSEACHIGSAKLPECQFRDKEKENEDYYLRMAQLKYANAEYVRKEQKTFADVGIPLDRVNYSFYSLEPQVEKSTDPVTFYYFNANGTEFYICNFLDSETNTWYSNFDELDITTEKEKKSPVHISVHFGNKE